MNEPLPTGFRIQVDPATRTSADGAVLWGGTPWRALRLTATGAQRLAWLRSGAAVDDARGGVLARRLVDTGLAHPRPPAPLPSKDLDVIVPARDRLRELDGCLRALAGLTVTVVDDGSSDGFAVAAVAARHGARLVRRQASGGPGAARNTGVAATRHAVVAFVDSDCVVDASALLTLAGHLGDPCVAAAAPRICEDGTGSPLDLGAAESAVRPGARVPFVPTTTLVVRRAAIEQVGGFEESLRYGEDVDLVWRLDRAGWSVRYDPSVVAQHSAPNDRLGVWARRYRYGTSIGPLARRHGAAISGPSLTGFVAPLRVRAVRAAGVPTVEAVRMTAMAPLRTATALLKWSLPRGPQDVAYGLGVWRGCISARTVRPLLPRLGFPRSGDGAARPHDDARMARGA